MHAFLAAANPTDHVVDQHIDVLGIPLTLHTMTLIVVSVVFLLAMLYAASRIATGDESEGNERYLTKGRFPQMIEAMTLYLRDEMLIPVMGDKTARFYLPYLLTLFFFILFLNVFGLIPIADIFHLAGGHPVIGGTATASITVTGALAVISFIMIQFHAFRELGVKGWVIHHFGGLVPGPIFLFPIAILVFIVEVAGDFIKPAALAIRLFANMVAGHTLMAVLLGFGYVAAQAAGGEFTLGVGAISLVSIVAAVVIMFLEVFVAFLQAFIFMFLTAVFISLMSHHDDHEHEHEHEDAGGASHDALEEIDPQAAPA